MDDDAEIIQEFLVESHENLDQLDSDLVKLERNPGSRELLSSIFRTIHTIKGTSGFLALGRLERLTHVGETLLSRLRDGELTMNEPIAEGLLRMVDTTRALLDAIERTSSDEAPEVDVASVVEVLEALLEGKPAEAAVVVEKAPAKKAAARKTAAQKAPAQKAPAQKAEPTQTPEPVAVAASLAGTPSRDHAVNGSASEHGDTPGAVALLEREPVEEPAAQAAVPAPVPDLAVAPEVSGPAAEVGEGEPERRGVVDSSVRVDVELLDSLVQLVGELVLTRNQIMQRTDSGQDVELVRAAQRLDLVASELQEAVMQTRMQPIGQVWSMTPPVERALRHQLGREVELTMEGHDTELDRSLLEALKGPLTHLVRNSMDHGIERPEDRLAAGKDRRGNLVLRAYHESGQVVVEITDDGKGIDPEKIGAVALQRGVVTRDQLARMDKKEILGLIFRPGFSTATEVTNVSGRGVGMDVVRTNIERIGGSVDVTSEVGRGTTTRVRIPLTLAIIPALVVGEGGERYAIPQANLVELVRLEGQDLRRDVDDLGGSPVLRLRGRLLPLVSLSEALGGPAVEDEALTVVVLQSDNVRFGLCVREVHDTQEIVVKPIGRQLKSMSMYAGATIMGDGRVALILDVPGIARTQGVADTVDEMAESRSGDDDRTALLVLEVADGRQVALPLGEVARLEEFPRERIEHSGGTEVVQYRDGILPLVRLASAIGLYDSAEMGDQVSVVVHEVADRSVGIVIDRVLDVVEATVVRSEVGQRAGVIGSAVVQDRVTDLVDLDTVVAWAGVGA